MVRGGSVAAPNNSKSIQELETEKLSQEMSRRVSQLSIINPAKTGQNWSDESDVCFLQGPEWGGDPATVPLHDRNLLQLHRDGTTETTETGRRVRPRLAH